MDQRDLHRVIIVSDPLHMARALRLSKALGIDALASSTPSTRFRSFHTSGASGAGNLFLPPRLVRPR